MATFYIKQNDTKPELSVTLKDAADAAVDITGNLGVRFHMRDEDRTTKVDAAATVVSAANGQVKYSWAAGDTDTAGLYEFEFEVTYSDSSVETFPNDGWDNVLVTGEIA